jgi:hypothetical protein
LPSFRKGKDEGRGGSVTDAGLGRFLEKRWSSTSFPWKSRNNDRKMGESGANLSAHPTCSRRFQGEKMKDRRKHTRVPASEMTYIVGLSSPGLIMDVSEGGLGVKYKGGEDLPDELTLDLLHASKSIIIDKVRCRKTRDETRGKVTVFSYISERHLGLQFLEPNGPFMGNLELFKGKTN